MVPKLRHVLLLEEDVLLRYPLQVLLRSKSQMTGLEDHFRICSQTEKRAFLPKPPKLFFNTPLLFHTRLKQPPPLGKSKVFEKVFDAHYTKRTFYGGRTKISEEVQIRGQLNQGKQKSYPKPTGTKLDWKYAYPSRTIVDDRPIVTDQTMRFAALLVIVASSAKPFIYTVLSKSLRERLGHMLPCRRSRAVSVSPKSTVPCAMPR